MNGMTVSVIELDFEVLHSDDMPGVELMVSCVCSSSSSCTCSSSSSSCFTESAVLE